ncbi:MAG TPA: FMN-binding negative transcriptional regulator [Caulobacteraceae bacterium]|nr:FMN-binding negative transcriptional regulator [Caulobacteraceae bacterium]
MAAREDGEVGGARQRKALLSLAREQRLAWVVTRDLVAGLLALQPQTADDDAIRAFAGHLARANPLLEALRRAPDALILLLGPHGYVSPSWLTDRTQAPTWNYAAARFRVRFEFLDDPIALRSLLDEQVALMEAGRPRAWRAAEMGPRYDVLARRIIGFLARVVEAQPLFKLSQADAFDQWAEITAGLRGDRAADLARWMDDVREAGR